MNINDLSLEEKIGQMLIVYYTSSEMDSNLKSALTDVKPGGFILFKENITTYDKTLKFIKDIKSTSSIPMFISIDQEGGNVQRLLSLEEEVSNIPYMNYVGDTNDIKLAEEVGRVIAEELRVFGINMDFAPVLDVNNNPNNPVINVRSYSDDPETVAKLGAKFIKERVLELTKSNPKIVDKHKAVKLLIANYEDFLGYCINSK